MKKYILAGALVLWTLWAGAQNPKAAEGSVVTAGNARFTVLTDRLIRMEWASDGVFEDRASLAIINRHLEVPEFKVSSSGGKTVIRTDALTLTYSGNGRFSEENLSTTTIPRRSRPTNGTMSICSETISSPPRSVSLLPPTLAGPNAGCGSLQAATGTTWRITAPTREARPRLSITRLTRTRGS